MDTKELEKSVDNTLGKIRDLIDSQKSHSLPQIKKITLEEMRQIIIKSLANLEIWKEIFVQKLNEGLSSPTISKSHKDVFPQILYWLKDEIILVYPKDKIETLSTVMSISKLYLKGAPKASKSEFVFDVDFKSEFVKASKNKEYNQVSLVAQAMFIVCHQNGVLFTLHDRSFSGAEDRLSKYALITGRLAISDLETAQGATTIDSLCRENALRRELQEVDELGLSEADAITYTGNNKIASTSTERTQFIGVYPDKHGKVLSFLHAIFVTIDEYNSLTKRGAYLVPLTPKVFSKLRRLNLLNDILDKNSCSNCVFSEEKIIEKFTQRDKKKQCRECENSETCLHKGGTCIIWDIPNKSRDVTPKKFPKRVLDEDKESNFNKNQIRLEYNATIIAIDIPSYSQLTPQKAFSVRDQLEKLIYAFLPLGNMNANKRNFHISLTPRGFIISLLKSDETSDKEEKRALIAYFLSIYLNMKLSKLDNDFNNIRVSLHADKLISSSSFSDEYFLGNGINKAVHILNYSHKEQILCSQNFAIQLLTEIEKYNFDLEIDVSNKVEYLKNEKKSGIWNERELKECLSDLKLPPIIKNEICEDQSIRTCFTEKGLPMHNFGFFTEEGGHRQRVFNLGIFPNAEDDKPQKKSLPEYGNFFQPISNIPIISRNKITTEDEIKNLIDSFAYVQNFTTYGYSNVRLLKGIYERYFDGKDDEAISEKLLHLVDFNVVFYDYEQYKHINETQSTVIARANWIRGVFYALKIASVLKKSEKINISIKVNKTRYGFNVLKLIYATAASLDYKDHIRFTVPMPGQAFELSPVFKIRKGDALFHGFLEICEKYIEQGIKENSSEITVKEIKLSEDNKGIQCLNELFPKNMPGEIFGLTKKKYSELVIEYNERIKQKENMTGFDARLKEQLGIYYSELLKTNNYEEAYRLNKCFGYVETLMDEGESSMCEFFLNEFEE